MSKLSGYFNAILKGGLPAALDYGKAAGTKQSDTGVEKEAPSGTARDQDTAKAAAPPANFVAQLDAKSIMIGVAGLVVGGLVLLVAIKALGKS